MKIGFAVLVASVALSGAAYAQVPSASATPEPKAFMAGFAQAAFGNTSSQSYGAEVGYTIRPGLEVVADGGFVNNTASSTFTANAQLLATGVARVAGSANYSAKQPLAFGQLNVRYTLPTAMRIRPYITVGGGMARVKKDTTFSTPAGPISNYLTLGSDMSGTETKAMVSAGAGIAVPVGRVLYLDLQYRFGRVFADEAINVNRAGVGLGVRF